MDNIPLDMQPLSKYNLSLFIHSGITRPKQKGGYDDNQQHD